MRLVFDRGTLLLEEPPAHLDPSTLPGARVDPRVGALRAKASHHRALKDALTEAGIPVDDVASRRTLPPPRLEPPELRPYQRAALDAWDLAGRRGLVVLPTGAGKTRVAIAAAARAATSVLCLVPTRVLLAQWIDAWKAAGVPVVGCYGDGERRLAPVTVSTYESAWRHLDVIGDRFGLLVADEAHHLETSPRAEALEMSIAPLRLGLTATPGKDPHGRVRDLVGSAVYALGIQDLAGTYLADFDVVRLHVELNADERAVYDEAMATYRKAMSWARSQAPEGSYTDLVGLLSRSDEGRAALRAFQRAERIVGCPAHKRALLDRMIARLRETNVRGIVFVRDNEDAYDLARSHLIMPITCDISRAERDEALARYRSGELSLLVSAQVLNEGFDLPDAEVAIVVGGRLGEREHIQRIGRVLRPRPDKRAVVYELVARDTHEVRRADRRSHALAARRPAPN